MRNNLKSLIRRAFVRLVLGEVVTELESATLTSDLEAVIAEELATYEAANP